MLMSELHWNIFSLYVFYYFNQASDKENLHTYCATTTVTPAEK